MPSLENTHVHTHTRTHMHAHTYASNDLATSLLLHPNPTRVNHSIHSQVLYDATHLAITPPSHRGQLNGIVQARELAFEPSAHDHDVPFLKPPTHADRPAATLTLAVWSKSPGRISGCGWHE